MSSLQLVAVVLSTIGRTEDALKAAIEALHLKTELDSHHLHRVGAAYAVAGHYEEARDPLQRYLSRFPGHSPQRVRPSCRGAEGSR